MGYNVNTDLILGNSLMLYVNNEPIAFAKTLDLTINGSEVDTTNKMSGRFKASIGGMLSYTITSDFLYTSASGDTSYNTLLGVMLAGQSLNFVIGTTTDSTAFSMTKGLYSGTANITSLSLKAEDNQIVTCSISLQGSGALVQVTT
jgi:predicted secreted protein